MAYRWWLGGDCPGGRAQPTTLRRGLGRAVIGGGRRRGRLRAGVQVDLDVVARARGSSLQVDLQLCGTADEGLMALVANDKTMNAPVTNDKTINGTCCRHINIL